METPNRGPYRPRIDPPEETPKTLEKIPIDRAISFIADNINDDPSERRSVRDKVSKRMKYAIDHGQLCVKNDEVVFGELMAWARDEEDWKERLSKYPRLLRWAISESSAMSGGIKEVTLPGTLERSHKKLMELMKRYEERERQLREIVKDSEQLRAKAARYDEICETNRDNGGKRQV